MPLDRSLIREAHELNAFAHETASAYYHSRPIASSNSGIILPTKVRHGFDIEYDVKDLIMIGAMTRNTVLLTGSTDIGKTLLSKLMMNSLFGKEEVGWHRVDVDIDFGKDTYTDTNFEIIKEGQKISDGLYRPNNFLSLPGIIWDEINRTHAKLGNKLLHVLDRDISLPDGKRIKLGVPCGGTDTYQFQIAAINEGDEYKGTFDMDKALRRRTVIEFPFDIFPLTSLDRLRLKKSPKDINLGNARNNLETILKIYKNTQDSLPLHPTAEIFASYIESFDYCKNSLTGEKGSVASKEGSVYHICERAVALNGTVGTPMCCEFLKSFTNNLCPYIKGITPGISKNLVSVAKGFALLRANKFAQMTQDALVNDPAGLANAGTSFERRLSYVLSNPKEFENSLRQYTQTNYAGADLGKAAVQKYCDNLEVEIGDIESALGFVGYSKIGIAPLWVVKHYQGNRYQALKNFSIQAKAKLEEGLSRPEVDDVLERVLVGKGTPAELRKIKAYCDSENPWLWRAITPYLDEQKIDGRGEEIKSIYGD